MSRSKRMSKPGRPVDKLARRLERKEKRRTARKQQKQEGKRLEAEKREVDKELLLLAALRDEEETEMAEERLVPWCQRCLRHLRQNGSHVCVFPKDAVKCEYCQRQGRGRFNGVEACRPVPVKDNDLARRVVVRHSQFISNPGNLQARRLGEAAKTLDYSMRERKASPRKKQVGEKVADGEREVREQEDNGGEDGFRVCGADFRLLRTVKRFMQTPDGANFVRFMHGAEVERNLEEGGRQVRPIEAKEGVEELDLVEGNNLGAGGTKEAPIEVDLTAPEEGGRDNARTLGERMRGAGLSGGHMCTPSPPVEGDECASPPSVVKSLGRAVGRFFW